MRTFKHFVVAGALALAASAAIAQPSVPPQPAPGPTPDGDSGNSGIIVSAWDSTRNLSIVQYLGLRVDDLMPNSAGGNATPEAGLTLNFGKLSGWDALFGTDTSVNAQGIVYTVSGFDNTPSGLIGKRIITTGTDPVGNVRNTAVSQVLTNAGTFIASGLNSAGGCNGVNPCTTNNPAAAGFAGQAGWADKYGGALPFSASANAGTSLDFFLLAPNSNSGGTTLSPVIKYQNSTGLATWLLSADGTLTYTVPGGVGTVPLPAAVWLLMSGLAGFGVIGRRGRRGAVAA
jgi:hypothetical protein